MVSQDRTSKMIMSKILSYVGAEQLLADISPYLVIHLMFVKTQRNFTDFDTVLPGMLTVIHLMNEDQ